MRKLLLKLVGGLGLGAAFVLATSTGASATNNYGGGHDSYKQSSHGCYSSCQKHHNYQVKYSYHENHKEHQKKTGYWDKCGRWVAYHEDYKHHEWKKWHKQTCHTTCYN